MKNYEIMFIVKPTLSEEDIKNYKKIVNYDEIVLKKQK